MTTTRRLAACPAVFLCSERELALGTVTDGERQRSAEAEKRQIPLPAARTFLSIASRITAAVRLFGEVGDHASGGLTNRAAIAAHADREDPLAEPRQRTGGSGRHQRVSEPQPIFGGPGRNRTPSASRPAPGTKFTSSLMPSGSSNNTE
jgi:hypothetical protein